MSSYHTLNAIYNANQKLRPSIPEQYLILNFTLSFATNEHALIPGAWRRRSCCIENCSRKATATFNCILDNVGFGDQLYLISICKDHSAVELHSVIELDSSALVRRVSKRDVDFTKLNYIFCTSDTNHFMMLSKTGLAVTATTSYGYHLQLLRDYCVLFQIPFQEEASKAELAVGILEFNEALL